MRIITSLTELLQEIPELEDVQPTPQVLLEEAWTRAETAPTPEARAEAVDAAVEMKARVETWQEHAEGDPFPALDRQCACGPPTDRLCLGCGARWCPQCQPAASGAACHRCRGPVWKDHEPRTPKRRHPQMKGF